MPFMRKLLPADLSSLKAHFARLDADDRHMRFGHGVSAATVEAYLDNTDWVASILLGHFESGVLRAVVEIVPLDDGFARQAELALTVEKPWRERGIGTELCRRVLVLACNRRVREVIMICLAENVPMRRLATKLNGRVLHLSGEVESRVLLPRPSTWSAMQEGLITGAAVLGGVSDQWMPGDGRAGAAG